MYTFLVKTDVPFYWVWGGESDVSVPHTRGRHCKDGIIKDFFKGTDISTFSLEKVYTTSCHKLNRLDGT